MRGPKRALVRGKIDSAPEHVEDRLNVIIVEAMEQELLIPAVRPNASWEFLGRLLQSLPLDANRMLAAPLSAVRLLRHRHGCQHIECRTSPSFTRAVTGCPHGQIIRHGS